MIGILLLHNLYSDQDSLPSRNRLRRVLSGWYDWQGILSEVSSGDLYSLDRLVPWLFFFVQVISHTILDIVVDDEVKLFFGKAVVFG